MSKLTVFQYNLFRDVYHDIVKNDVPTIIDLVQPISPDKTYENRVCCDRFGYMNKYAYWKFPEDGLYVFPRDVKNKSLEEILYARVKYFDEKAEKENKRIYIALSGGVDSTTAVCSFIRYSKNMNNVYILYTDKTVEEYPEIFDYFTKNNINLVYCNSESIYLKWRFAIQHHIVITGNSAENMGPSDMLHKVGDKDWYYKDYKDHLKHLNWTDKNIEQAEDVMNYYNLAFNTAGSFWWLMIYCVLYMSTKHYLNFQFGLTEPIYSFYDSSDFDEWGIVHQEDIVHCDGDDPKTYKIEMKKFIYETVHHEDYYKNKAWYGSWKYNTANVLRWNKNIVFAYDDGYKKICERDDQETVRNVLLKERKEWN